MTQRYVFIVGLPRTGSKLVENILKNCPYIDFQSAGETKYVGHLITSGIKDKMKKVGDLSKDENVHKLHEYFYTGTPNRGFWMFLRQNNPEAKIYVDKDAFLQALLDSDRTEKGIFEVILRIHTEVTEKTVLADKTNPHLYHVSTLLEWFPEAKVIHLIRDPRAILASNLNKTRPGPEFWFVRPGNPIHTLMSVCHTTFTWLYAIYLDQKYKKAYPNNYTLIKFEDLIQNSEATIKELCTFLEIQFDPQMLNPKRTGSSFDREPAAGIDTKTLTRWKQHLPSWMQTWLQFWTKRYLKEFGYM